MTSESFNRPGAVDLSALASQAKASASAGPGGASYVLDVTEQTFDEVMQKSLQHPVIVELTSPRANAQQLSDTLTELANAAAGKYLLARVNAETEPRIVQAFQIQAVPTVVAVIGGQVAPLFQGMQPREQVEAIIDQVLSAAVANGVVGTAQPVAGPAPDQDAGADEPDPRFAAADAALEQGDFATAEAEFDKLLAADPNDAEAKAGKAQVGLLARAADLDAPTVLAAAAEPDADVDSHLQAADVEMISGSPEAAFARLLGLVRTAAGDEKDRARVRLLELFETLDGTDPRVLKARRDLMSALF